MRNLIKSEDWQKTLASIVDYYSEKYPNFRIACFHKLKSKERKALFRSSNLAYCYIDGADYIKGFNNELFIIINPENFSKEEMHEIFKYSRVALNCVDEKKGFDEKIFSRIIGLTEQASYSNNNFTKEIVSTPKELV